MSAKKKNSGLTPWFPRSSQPVRPGFYECAVRLFNSQKQRMSWTLEWDGTGFLVPFPMIVDQWRGLRSKPSKKEQA